MRSSLTASGADKGAADRSATACIARLRDILTAELARLNSDSDGLQFTLSKRNVRDVKSLSMGRDTLYKNAASIEIWLR